MTMTARSRPIAEVFRHRNFLLFMLGLGPHAISSWMYRVGVGWLAWEMTRSTVWLGVIAAADLIPVLLLSPIAGVVTDRIVPVRELRLTQWLQFVQCAVLVALLHFGAMTIELLLVLTLALGLIQTFGGAARHATVPYTVPRELVATAVALDTGPVPDQPFHRAGHRGAADSPLGACWALSRCISLARSSSRW